MAGIWDPSGSFLLASQEILADAVDDIMMDLCVLLAR